MATRPTRPRATSQLAKLIVDLSTGETQATDPNAGKNPAAIEIARGRYHVGHRGHRPDRRHRIVACGAGTERVIPRTLEGYPVVTEVTGEIKPLNPRSR